MSPFESWFPNLGNTRYSPQSGSSSAYNCIGWAIGIRQVWDPDRNYRWARGVYRAASVENVLRVLQQDGGYERCADGSLEADIEKVAIYGKGLRFTHVARQRASGAWTSKLGRLEDIEHESLDALAGDSADAYGAVVAFMKRARRPEPDWADPLES